MLQNVTQKAGRDFRALVDGNMAELNSGVGFGDDGMALTSRINWKMSLIWVVIGALLPGEETVLADQIRSGLYVDLTPDEHERFVANPSLTEEYVYLFC